MFLFVLDAKLESKKKNICHGSMIAAHLHYVINSVVPVVSLEFADGTNNIWQNTSKEKNNGLFALDMNVLFAEK